MFHEAQHPRDPSEHLAPHHVRPRRARKLDGGSLSSLRCDAVDLAPPGDGDRERRRRRVALAQLAARQVDDEPQAVHAPPSACLALAPAEATSCANSRARRGACGPPSSTATTSRLSSDSAAAFRANACMASRSTSEPPAADSNSAIAVDRMLSAGASPAGSRRLLAGEDFFCDSDLC